MSVFDNNGDNRTARDDFEILVEQISGTPGINPADLQVLNNSIERIYEATEMIDGVSYSHEEYRRKIHSKLEDPLIQEAIRSILSTYFDRLDADRDGIISPIEYRSYMENIMGHDDPNDVDDAYNSIDSNGEGKIRRIEWINYGFEYFYSANKFERAKNRINEKIQRAPCCGRQSIYCVPCPQCFNN